MRSRGAQRGQATVDYVALLAVFVLLLGAAAAVAGIGAPGFVNAVVGQVHRALCIVGGRSCEVERPRPCTVASKRDSHHFAVNVVVLRGGRDRYVLRERLSDGTVRLTVATHVGGGFEVGIGGRAELSKDGRTLGAVDEARAGIELLFGQGQVFVARDDRDADAIVRAIRGDDRLPSPREVFYEGGARAFGKLGLSALIAGAWSDGEVETVVGVREDRAGGTTTVYLNYGGAANALAHALLSGPAAAGAGQAIIAVTLDRDGRQAALSLSGAVTHGGGPAGPGEQKLDGERREFSASVDLTDPDVAAAWTEFRRRPKSLGAIAALAQRMRARARLDVREYSVGSSTRSVIGGIGVLFRLGAESTDTVQLARLRAAATRPPGGLWESRLDCVPMVV